MSKEDGHPTGLLNEDGTMMQVHCFALGNRWVPISGEVRAKIEAENNPIISLGATVNQQMVERLYADDLTPSRRVVSSDDPNALPITPEEEREWMSRSSSHGEIGKWSKSSEGVVNPETLLGDVVDSQVEDQGEHSGFDVNYYCIPILHPKREGKEPYVFEVEDLIQALNMGFHEGTVLKSLVRSAAERELGLKKQGGDALRDAEKMVHSSKEHHRALKIKVGA